MRTLWKNALLMTMDDARRSSVVSGDLLVDGDTIRAAGPNAGATLAGPEALTSVDATGLMIIPGLVNAHTHSWETVFRGTSERVPLELWMLETYPPTAARPMPARLVYLRTLVAAMDALHGGTTTVLDDVGELPWQTPESLAAVFDAYEHAGIRATCTGGVADVAYADRLPFSSDLLTAEAVDASRAAMPPSRRVIDDFVALSEHAFATQHGRGEGRLSYAVAPSAPQRSSDELLLAAAELSARHDAVLHLHLLETRLQAVMGRERYGSTIVEHLERLRLLGPRTALAHAIWLSPGDIATLGASPATIIHNPVSNLKLGSGVFPWRALADAGATLALGTDGTASNDSLRMLDTLKSAALLQTVADPDPAAWPSSDEVLWAATRGGARATGRATEVGSLEAGRRADFVVLDLTLTTNFTPLNDAARQLVFSENGGSIVEVWVNGERVVQNGRSTRIDERAVLAEFRELAAEYLAGHRQTVAANRPHGPAIRNAYDRVRQTPWPEREVRDENR
jgi:5-methylthioadenosine/S-adenosylhomocysteine deaminase